MSFEIFPHSIKQSRSLQHEVEVENVQRVKCSPARLQARQIHRGQRDQVPGIPTEVRTREGNHGGPSAQPIRPQRLLSSGGCFRELYGSDLQFLESIRLYVALNDSPLQNLFFQTVGDVETFTLGFEFVLLYHYVESDIVQYGFTYGEFKVRLYVWALIPSSRAGQSQTWISYTSCVTIQMTFPP